MGCKVGETNDADNLLPPPGGRSSGVKRGTDTRDIVYNSISWLVVKSCCKEFHPCNGRINSIYQEGRTKKLENAPSGGN